jgi:DNA-binding transcriptional LysR family regulator
MDLRQLRYLVAVSDAGGMRAAARDLHASQAQISRSLADLERELGVKLLTRNHRGVEVTSAGAELVVRAREIVAQMSAAETTIRSLRRPRSTTFRIGSVVGALSAGELLPPIIADFQAAHPDVAITIVDLGMQDQLSPLLRAEVDAAIVRPPLQHPEIVVTPIAQEPRILHVNRDHEIAEESSVSVDDVLHFPTMPLDSRPEWCTFWELDDTRGASNRHRGVAPATTVGESQLGAVNHPVILTTAGVNSRLAGNPLLRSVSLTGAAPSVIAIACLKRDNRRFVRDFVSTAAAVAERDIALLPGGTLPD